MGLSMAGERGCYKIIVAGSKWALVERAPGGVALSERCGGGMPIPHGVQSQ